MFVQLFCLLDPSWTRGRKSLYAIFGTAREYSLSLMRSEGEGHKTRMVTELTCWRV